MALPEIFACETCIINTGELVEEDRVEARQWVSGVERVVWMETELPVQLADKSPLLLSAVKACLEARRDKSCARYAE